MTRLVTWILAVGLSTAAAAGIAVAVRPSGPRDGVPGKSAETDGGDRAASPVHLLPKTTEPSLAPPPGAGGERPRTIHLSGLDNMTFSDVTLEARSGELIEIELHTIGAQPPDLLKHNFVLLDRGVSVDSFIRAAALARETGYVPPALENQVIAATSLAAALETVTTTFRTPTTPGQYPFVCSYPSHFAAGMTGTLSVK